MRRLVGHVTKVLLVGTMLAIAAVPTAGASGGDYEDPFFLNWPSFLAPMDTTYVPTAEDACVRGQNQCVDKVIRKMTKRFNRLECDHDSMFAFTYLLTTEEYRSAVDDPDFFIDNHFVNHQDVVFANYYFEAYDAWHSGDVAGTPPSWRIAFDAADKQQVRGLGNVMLGMNAHVNRDLPFVLAAIGLEMEDGTSRKADHDRVNDFLNAVNQYLLAEAATQLDPTVDDGDIPLIGLDNATTTQLLAGWREMAWRNAERLVAAPTPEARAQVAEEIEEYAADMAVLLRETFRYSFLDDLFGQGAIDRNAFCQTNFERR